MVRGSEWLGTMAGAGLLLVGCGDDSGEPVALEGSETGSSPTTGGEADTGEPGTSMTGSMETVLPAR